MPIPGLVANQDLTTAQYLVMQMAGTTGTPFCINESTLTTQLPIGILQNDPTTGEAAEVLGIGEVGRGHIAAAVTPGDALGNDTEGRLITVSTGSTNAGAYRFICATALGSGQAAGEIISILAVSPYLTRST